MPKVPIIMPQLGESIAEATVVRLTVNVGDQIETDQEVIEVETNKAVMSVTTPCKGLIESITAEVNETYPVGSTLGYIEASIEDAERLNAADSPVIDQGWGDGSADQSEDPLSDPSHSLEIPAGQNGAAFQSPRLRARRMLSRPRLNSPDSMYPFMMLTPSFWSKDTPDTSSKQTTSY